jgi:Ser/Thr protein kinase RdoA (MazF antagonist)
MYNIINNITVRSLVNSEYLLKIACSKYNLQDITTCRLLKFGGSNDIFLLLSSKRKLVLKIFFERKCWKYNENHYLFELEVQQYLNQHGISTSKPMTNKLGKLVDKILLAEGERFFAIFEFEKGKKWDHAEIKDQRFYKLGKTIAKLHEISSKFYSTINAHRKLDINLMLDKSWHEISHLVKLPSNKIKQQLYNIYLEMKLESENLIKNQELTLIHGDVHCGNHLYDAKTDIITLIDFELCGYGLINYELSVLKHDLINNGHKNTFISNIMDEFLNGYASVSSNNIDQNLINFFVKVRYFFMLGSSFLFYPDKAEFNNEYILNNFIKAIKKADKLT